MEHVPEDKIEIFKEFKELITEFVNTEIEEKRLSKLQLDFISDESCLHRYLRARDWVIDDSFEMLKNTLIWRNEYKPESITLEEIEEEANSGKMYVSEFVDKEGRPIILMLPGKDNTTERAQKVKYLVFVMEEAIFKMKKLNEENIEREKPIEKVCLMVDYTNCGLGMAGVNNTKISLECLNVLQDHYPERLGRAFMINTPFVFSAFWSIISKFLDPETSEKIQFIKRKNLKLLQKYIDPDMILKEFKGKNEYKWTYENWLENVDPFLQYSNELVNKYTEEVNVEE
eukprot:TRINITY_DN6554_c0_g4_i1.p1 TRINITY_DN6554_c0_g4~~TRINITY_DN6554_c0_g4_i1.p1  ORF type:complete len:286 (-),score=77.55 TRINITY_DN6554_c0_g4_i1:68-925(-)